MKNNWVITIGREFCSGGAETAHKLSKLLDIPYYDKEIIDEAVKTTQLAEDVVAHHDERPVGYADVGGYQYGGLWYTNDPSLLLPVGMRVADAQFEVIRRTASQGPCVIVGRCADLVETTQPTPTPSELPKTDDISAFSLSFWAAAIVMLGLLADDKRKRVNIR